jgi:hypothetical protein
MADSASGFEPEHDVDPASIERAQQLKTRRSSLDDESPQWRYLVETRRLPAAAVRRCAGDLATLAPPIPFFGNFDYGIVSIIRAADGEELGFAVEACNPAGGPVKRKRQDAASVLQPVRQAAERRPVRRHHRPENRQGRAGRGAPREGDRRRCALPRSERLRLRQPAMARPCGAARGRGARDRGPDARRGVRR